MRKLLVNIINPLSDSEAAYLPRHVICLEGTKILSIEPFDHDVHREYEDYLDCLALPGFIDLHVHLSQYLMRGLYEPALLPWLKKHVFPAESRSVVTEYAIKLAQLFFDALYACGTTMSVIYTAPFFSSCEAAFQMAEDVGVRAMIGMTMMDQNSPEELQQATSLVLDSSFRLYDRWHLCNPLLEYIFTPRFAPSCTMELMTETANFASQHGAWIQTHLSENEDEIEMVKQLFGLANYTQVYAQAGMLGSRTIFGHAIHLSKDELQALKDSNAKIAHCPDSNFYLKSGEFPLQVIEKYGIPYSLGSDVGAGTTLNMLHHAKMMNFRQTSYPVSPEKALYHITLGSAKVLEKESQIGSLAAGKEADIVILQPPEGYPPGTDSLSQLTFLGTEFRVRETIVAGTSKYKT